MESSRNALENTNPTMWKKPWVPRERESGVGGEREERSRALRKLFGFRVGSVKSPWHQEGEERGCGVEWGSFGGGVWRAGCAVVEEEGVGVSQLLLLWLYVLHGDGEELGW